MKSYKPPTPEQVGQVIASFAKGISAQLYFYERLENPYWLEPLTESGVFAAAPAPEIDATTGGMSLPLWAPASYLVKVAAADPDKVTAIALSVTITNNVRVYDDLSNIAVKLPGSQAALVAARITKWINDSNQLPLFGGHQLKALVIHLANSGQIKSSLDLTKAILQIVAVPNGKGRRKLKAGLTLVDDWQYNNFIESTATVLATACGSDFLWLLINLLHDAIEASGAIAPHTYSETGWPSLADTPAYQTIENILVQAIKKVYHIILKTPSDVAKFSEKLKARKYWLFFRIVLFIAAQRVPENLDLASALLTDLTIFDNRECRREYLDLLNKYLPLLAEGERNQVLDWIRKGPSRKLIKKRYVKFYEKEPTEEEIYARIAEYQRGWLSFIEAPLPVDLVQLREKIIEVYGAPERRSSVMQWMGPVSPIEQEALKAKSIPEVVEYLRSWNPPEEPRSASPEGLGRVLQNDIRSRPAEYAAYLQLFKGLRPTYIRFLISGLLNDTKDITLPLNEVLSLSEWVVAQPIGITSDVQDDFREDKSWQEARRVISRFLSSSMEDKKNAAPIELRPQIWSILVQLCQDPDPTPENEEKWIADGMGPASIAINSSRGEALNALIRYMLWVDKAHFKGKSRKSWQGFKNMPEVQKELERHLDLNADPSLAMRTIYGQWFPWINMVDSKWAAQHVDMIFPTSDKLVHLWDIKDEYWDAAWDSYIAHCNPYNEVFDVLKPKYEYAAHKLSKFVNDSGDGIDYNLGSHLVSFYWRGKLDLKSVAIQDYFKYATFQMTSNAVDFIGRSLYHTTDAIPSKVLSRLMEFWEWRKQAVEANSGADLHSFGMWFSCGKLDKKWSLDELQYVLGITKRLRPALGIVERLNDLVVHYPLEVATCLSLITSYDRDFSYLHDKDLVREVFLKIKKSGNFEAWAIIDKAIHELGVRSIMDYRDLR